MLDTQEVSGSSPLPHTTVDRRKNFWGFVSRIVRGSGPDGSLTAGHLDFLDERPNEAFTPAPQAKLLS